MSFISKLISKLGDWIASLFKHAETLYDTLSQDEKNAANWAYGVIAIINANIDKVPADIKAIIAEKYPELSADVLHGFLDRLLNDIKVIDSEVPLTLEDALEMLKTYLSKLDGDVWGQISSAIGSALAVLLSPETPIQKFASIAEYVYQLFVKPHVEAKLAPACSAGYHWDDVAKKCVENSPLPPDPTHPSQ